MQIDYIKPFTIVDLFKINVCKQLNHDIPLNFCPSYIKDNPHLIIQLLHILPFKRLVLLHIHYNFLQNYMSEELLLFFVNLNKKQLKIELLNYHHNYLQMTNNNLFKLNDTLSPYDAC